MLSVSLKCIISLTISFLSSLNSKAIEVSFAIFIHYRVIDVISFLMMFLILLLISQDGEDFSDEDEEEENQVDELQNGSHFVSAFGVAST